MHDLFVIQISPSQVYNYSLGKVYFSIDNIPDKEMSL